MPSVAELMEQHFSDDHGTVDVKAVLNALEDVGVSRAPALIDLLDDPAQRRWRLSAVDGLRALAARNECTMDQARKLLAATELVALEQGLEEYLKTFNALVSSTECAPSLLEFIRSHAQLSEDDRWLSFYAAGLLAQRRPSAIPPDLHSLLASAAEVEPVTGRRNEYAELLHNLP
jgi:hypothetical protein